MKIVDYIVPVLLLVLLLYALINKTDVYSSFLKGGKKAISLIVSIFPCIVAIFLMLELFSISGLENIFINTLSPVFKIFGVPKEVIKLVLLKPFSGSGSLTELNNIFIRYGVDSQISLIASAIYGSSETIFYISAIYFVNCKNKKATKGIIISIVACLISTVLGTAFCKIFY